MVEIYRSQLKRLQIMWSHCRKWDKKEQHKRITQIMLKVQAKLKEELS